METSTNTRPPGLPPTTVILGDNVYRLRVLKNPKWSQGRLAAESGVSVETIRLLEMNRDPHREQQLSPHHDTVDKIAAALGVEPSKLYEYWTTPSKPTGQPRHLSLVPKTGDALPVRP